MHRVNLVLLILLSFSGLTANTHEVSLDGTLPYLSIQDAINSSSNSDTILVHPGRYFENIDFVGKSITVCSEYVSNPNWDIVESTIIDGNEQSSCVVVINGELNAVLNGFTVTNGIGYGNSRYGGGVYVNFDSNLNLENCLVEDNHAINCGGVLTGQNSLTSITGCVIRNNSSVYIGGGVGVYTGTLNLSLTNLNRIYNNYGDVQDIFIYNSQSTNIVLDTLSVNLTEPDGFFVSYFHEDGLPAPEISVQNNYFDQFDSDLYVSPTGDDSNNGLTPETPLQTIAYANRIIQPDSLNPNTVYLLPGTYSSELNNQFFPIALQSHTKMLGGGDLPDEVIIGSVGEESKIGISNATNVEVGNFTISHANENVEAVLLVSRSCNVFIHDVESINNYSEYPGLLILYSNNIIFNNISINSVDHDLHRISCIKTYECENTIFNNTIINSISNIIEDGSTVLVRFSRSKVSINNMLITNVIIEDTGVVFSYGNSVESNVVGNLELYNFLAYNNTSLSNSMPMFNFSTYHEECYINNMTIAHNTGPTAITRFGGDYTIRNSIIYNPNSAYEMGVWVPADGDPTPNWSNIDIDYSLVRNGLASIPGADNPNNNVLWGVNNIDVNPLFRGDMEGDIPVGDPRWVQLTENSPCVNAGTPDTLGMNLPSIDITGNPRVWDNIIDMGAHEYNPTVDNSYETAPTPPATIQVSHFPNPVTPNGSNDKVAFIEFTLPKKPIEKPTLEIYNIKGQKVRDLKITQSFSQLVRSAGLSTEEKQSGEKYSQMWDCRDNNRKTVATGIYFYKVSSEGEEAIGKMMIMK